MQNLNESLVRTIVIQATPETVFRFFTDSERWARWWGAGSSIEPRTGGSVKVIYPNRVEASGEVLEIEPPRRIVFTYGYASGDPIPPGASRVTITVEPHERGSQLHLLHEFADAAARDRHIQGWRFQLSVFANVVAEEVNASAEAIVDAWFAAWAMPDDEARRAALARIAAPGIRFGDRFSLIEGVPELAEHAGAAQRFMRVRLERRGGVRHCQGVVLSDWAAIAEDGQVRGTGTNVFVFGPEARIEAVTGLWNMAGRAG